MPERESILQSVYRAIDATNEQLPSHDTIVKTPTAPLYGGSGPLDSLGLISLIVEVEKRIEIDFGHTVSLMADSTAASGATVNDPFASVETLVDWLVTWLPASKSAA